MFPNVQTLRRILVAATVLVVGAGLLVELCHHTIAGFDSPFIALLSLSEEGNLPTWYSAVLLFSCALALFVVAAEVRHAKGLFLRRWQLLGVIFVYLSIDESVQLHEHLNGLFSFRGALYFGWIIPVAVALVPLALGYLRLLLGLPAPIRRRFVIAGVMYVGGALGMEIPLGLWVERHGEDTLGYAVIDWVEETLEMAGAALFLLAIVRHRQGLRATEPRA